MHAVWHIDLSKGSHVLSARHIEPNCSRGLQQAIFHSAVVDGHEKHERPLTLLSQEVLAANTHEHHKHFDSQMSFLAGGHVDAMPGHSGAQPHQVHMQPKGGKPLWVLNGRVYNYRKEGASPAPNQAAADELVAMQKAEADSIQGLGAGGNRAQGEHLLLLGHRSGEVFP